MKNSLNRLLAGIACTALIAGLSVPAHAAQAQPDSYVISAAQWSREDFSQDANPDVFTATYDRALYNAIRQTLVDGTSDTAPAYPVQLWLLHRRVKTAARRQKKKSRRTSSYIRIPKSRRL